MLQFFNWNILILSESVCGYVVSLNQQTHSNLFIYESFTDSVGTLVLLDEFIMQNQTENTFIADVVLSLVSFAGITLNKCAAIWIGTLTGGPVQGESPPVLV